MGFLKIHHGPKIAQNIGFCLTSFSKNQIISVAKILEKFNIKPYITDKERRIYLYNQKSVSEYLSIFGSSNPRILGKFDEWKSQKGGIA